MKWLKMKMFWTLKYQNPLSHEKIFYQQSCSDRGIILSSTRVKKGPFKIGPPVIGYIFSYNQLCEVDHH